MCMSIQFYRSIAQSHRVSFQNIQYCFLLKNMVPPHSSTEQSEIRDSAWDLLLRKMSGISQIPPRTPWPPTYTLLHAVVNKTHAANHPKQILYILMFMLQVCFRSHSARGTRNLHSLSLETVDSTWKRDTAPSSLSNLKPETNHW